MVTLARALAASSILLGLALAAGSARAADGDPSADVDDGPALGRLEQFDASFTFVKPGQTTVPQALKRLGAPALDYPAWVAKGKIDYEIEAPTIQSISRLSKEREKVRVLEWYDGRDETRPAAKLVFRDDVVWYALVPFTASESSPAKLESRYGTKPAVITQPRLDADVGHELTIYGYPDQGVGYVRDDFGEAADGPSFRTKVLFPPVRK